MKRIYTILLALMLMAGMNVKAQDTWTKVANTTDLEIVDIKTYGNTILAAAGEKVLISTDAGSTWQLKDLPANSGNTGVRSLLLINGKIYAGTFGAGVLVSEDMGASWRKINSGLTTDFASHLVYAGNAIYAGTPGAGVFRLDLTGGNETWTAINQGINDIGGLIVQTLVATPDRLVMVSDYDGKSYYRDLNGSSWTLNRIVPAQEQFMTFQAIVHNSNIYLATEKGVYRSNNGGEAWTRLNVIEGDYLAACFAASGNILYTLVSSTVPGPGAGTYVRHTDNNGDQWSTAFLPDISFFTMHIAYGKIFVGNADGLYYKNNPATSVEDEETVVKGFGLSQNYPNPFNPSTKISFEIMEAGNYTLEVFDITGKSVGIITSGYMDAGRYSVNFDASKISGGVYVYRLSNGVNSIMKKMMLVK